jgi:5-oxoprolinase (ATP-hydrolysing)
VYPAPVSRPWLISIDTGGTFTDCLAWDPAGNVSRVKVLSSSALRATVRAQGTPSRIAVDAPWLPRAAAAVGMEVREAGGPARAVIAFETSTSALHLDGPLSVAPGDIIELSAREEAPILAARLATGTPVGGTLPPIAMRLGTTRGTNALLERRSGPVALFITRGFGDLLEIGDQQRRDIFALDIRKPAPLHSAVVEVPGRLDSGGREISPPDLDQVENGARAILASGIRCAAVTLMHSWLNPAHERAVASLLARLGFAHISISSDLAPLIKILPRAQTTVVNAYLSPVIDTYVARIAGALGIGDPRARGSSLHMMTSAGGLVRDLRPKDSLLSGPAGGVVGAGAAGRSAGFERTIAFDMGGTSTDVSRLDGRPEYDFEHRVGDARILAPALAIESVAAGGGSICRAVDGELRVGPESAGASPGPACYSAGGPLTITDCNLLLGRLDPDGFQIPVRAEPAGDRLAELIAALREQTGQDHDPGEAIARISIRHGYNPADYALVCFGGAGGQHACGIAERLGIRTVVVPADAGLLSAAGIAAAPIERFAERQVLKALDSVSLPEILAELEVRAGAAVAAEGVPTRDIAITRRLLSLRLHGQDSTIEVEHPAGVGAPAAAAVFRARFVDQYGHPPADRPIELAAARVAASSEPGPPMGGAPAPSKTGAAGQPARRRSARFGGRMHDVAVLDRGSLAVGAAVFGPALILDPYSTTVIAPGWACHVHESTALILAAPASPRPTGSVIPAAVRDELATGRLLAIARDMGEMLERTALSTNVKERLDFSCAILDADARLVVNAPHIPVHLGALGVCVRRVLESIHLAPGDVVMTNHPAFGGSHLPDITVITPVFLPAGAAPIAFIACRAHHAEIGGTRPGSMPTDARSLAEEGVVIPPTLLVRSGQDRWDDTRRLLTSAPFPTRAIADNLADLAAQVAANYRGVTALVSFAAEHSVEELRRAMASLTARAARATRAALARLASRATRYEAAESLDDGSPIHVRINIAPNRAVIDFAGSAPVHSGNLNATAAIVRSATMYVIRLLLGEHGEQLPLNEGLLDPIDLRIPRGMLNPEFPADPARCPAVAGGNVETSQRVVDTLLKALGLAACSQGTMNNTLFGNATFGYYETVCGGAGAGPGFDGASAVHTHMTNTRITDPEVLEHRYPVRLDRFAIRRGSGGAGRHRGGEGAVRELTFLAPSSLSLLTQHRAIAPYGLAGGAPGQAGSQRLIRADGRIEALSSVDGREVAPGDRLILETPGGGGYGPPRE